MILEAFSQYLHNAAPELPASLVLSTWLWERLSGAPKSAVDQVIHCEVAIARATGTESFTTSSHPRTIRLPADAELALRIRSSVRRKEELEKAESSAYFFKGTSTSGSRLLNSLYEYSMSYEQVKWSRFVHSVKASDFRLP